MKKGYIKPTLRVVKIQQAHSILQASKVNSVGGNADLNYGGGSSDPARGRSFDSDEWDE